MLRRLIPFAILVALVGATLSEACSICGINLQRSPTIREDATRDFTKYLAYGVPIKSNVDATGRGSTVMKVLKEIKTTPSYKGKKTITIGRYLPVDEADPRKFLVFADVLPNKLDAYRGVPVKSDDVVAYTEKGMTLDPKKPEEFLGFYFQYLEHADAEIASDAFLTFAKADDSDIAKAAPSYSASKLRRWLQEPTTEVARLGVYALMLGACGTDADASLLVSMIANEKDDRVRRAYDGLLSGYLMLRPQQGWSLLYSILSDGQKSLQLRLAAVRALRYAYGAHPEKNKQYVLRGLRTIIGQGELADLAIEDLRRSKLWELTDEILSRYGKKGFTAPLMKRAIVRYALSCPQTASVKAFLAERRKSELDLVSDVEEALSFEK